MAEIVGRDCLEDHPEWVGLMLSWCAGKAMQTFLAPIELDGLKTVFPLALPYGIFRVTGWADRILLLGLNVRHGMGATKELRMRVILLL